MSQPDLDLLLPWADGRHGPGTEEAIVQAISRLLRGHEQRIAELEREITELTGEEKDRW